MSEEDIQKWLSEKLLKATDNLEILKSLTIHNSTSDSLSVFDLVGHCDYKIFTDDTDWNPHKEFLKDLVEGKRPDIVLRSLRPVENRIIIEVKEKQGISGKADSQLICYFLHLLGTTRKVRDEKGEIRRAVLLAAPSYWFEEPSNAEKWKYFVDKMGDLARAFKITLGEIRCDQLE
jgi:hypothetical protein